MLEIRYVWEWPVRISHWINALSIVVLSVTGIYIGAPFLVASEASSAYVMGWTRFIHYVFAYLFSISLLVRLIWFFAGNRHASWRAFVPWSNKEGRGHLISTFKYYTFLERKVPEAVGHNALAAVAYTGVFALFLLQIATGFALYGQFAPGGVIDTVFGSLLLFGPQALRLVHHLVMWLLIGFAIHHVYSSWLMDIKEKNGTLSSIFSGYKFIPPEKH
jgi:Ni/Fe-hydrogenase 1 B-type cytochrome subunit